MLDFLNLPPIPPGAFDLATRKDQICLKTSTPKNTLLPEDFHYKVCVSCCLRIRCLAAGCTNFVHKATDGNQMSVRPPAAAQLVSDV